MRIALTATYEDILHDDLIRLTRPIRKADPVQPSDAKLNVSTVVLARHLSFCVSNLPHRCAGVAAGGGGLVSGLKSRWVA